MQRRIMERIDKILSGTGLYTRSQVKGLISRGLVAADGVPVRTADSKFSRDAVITVQGEVIDTAEFVYYMMNKPADYICAVKDERYPAVVRLLPEALRNRGLQPVGRLDADVTGLLLLTDDGQTAHKIMSPKSAVRKTYEIFADGPVAASCVKLLADGAVTRDGQQYKPARLVIDEADAAHCFLTVTEGKFHEVKNLIAVCGRHVQRMARVSIGDLQLDAALAPGEGRPITQKELNACFA